MNQTSGLNQDAVLGVSGGSSLDSLGGPHPSANPSLCQPSCFPGIQPPFNSGGNGGIPFRGPMHMSPFPSDLGLGGSGASARSHEGNFLPQLSGIGGQQGFPGFSSFAGVDAARAALFFAHSSCPPSSLPCQNGAMPSQSTVASAGAASAAPGGSGPVTPPNNAGVVGASGSGPEGPGNFMLSPGAPQPGMPLFGGGNGHAGMGTPVERSHGFLDAASAVGGANTFSMPNQTNYGLPGPFGTGVSPPTPGCPGGWSTSSLSLNPSLLLPSNVQPPEGFPMPDGNSGSQQTSNFVAMGNPGCPAPAVPPRGMPHSPSPGQSRDGSAAHSQSSAHALSPQGPANATVKSGGACAPGGLASMSNASTSDVAAGTDAAAENADTAESIPSNALPKKYSGIWFDPQQNCWRASWVCATSGKRKFRYFSAAKFGHRHALQLAKVTKERAVERKKIRLPAAHGAAGRGATAALAGTLMATPTPKLEQSADLSKAFLPEKAAGDSVAPGAQGAAVEADGKDAQGSAALPGMASPAPACVEAPCALETHAVAPACPTYMKEEASVSAPGPGAPQPSSDPPVEGTSVRDEDGRRPGGALDPVALAEKAREMLKVPGVYYDSARMIWRAFWHEGGRRVIRYFTVNKHGFQRAHELALLTRRQAAMAMQQRRRQLTAGLVLAVNCGTGPASPGAPTTPGSVESRDGAEKDALGNVLRQPQPGMGGMAAEPFAGSMQANANVQTNGAGPGECVNRSGAACTCGQTDGMHAAGCQLLGAGHDRGVSCAGPPAGPGPFLAPNQGMMGQGVPGAVYPAHAAGNYYGQPPGARGLPTAPGARPGTFGPSVGAVAPASFPPPSPSGTTGTTSSGGGCRVDYLERVAQLPKEDQVEWSEELKAWVVTPFPTQGSGSLSLKGTSQRGSGSAEKGEGGSVGHGGTRLSRMADGREILKMFTIRKYGFRVAREMAIEWRNRRREKVRVENEQQQILQLRHSKGGSKGPARDTAACASPATPGVQELDSHAVANSAPSPTGANPVMQGETRRAASPSFSASTCSSNPSSPPNSSGPHQQNLRHLMVSATGTACGSCDPASSGLPSFMHMNIPCGVAGQTPPPETPNSSVSSLSSAYNLASSGSHLASQNPLFFPQAPSGGLGGGVSPMSPFPAGLGPAQAVTGSLAAPGAPSLPGGSGGARSSASSMLSGSASLPATASGPGAFPQHADARSLPSGCGVPSESAAGSGVLAQAASASAAGSLAANLGFVGKSEQLACAGNREVPAGRADVGPANWMFLSDANTRCPRGEETGSAENHSATPFAPSPFDQKVGAWPTPQGSSDALPRSVGTPGAAGPSGASLGFFQSPAPSPLAAASTSYPCLPASSAAPALPHVAPCTSSAGDAKKAAAGGVDKPLHAQVGAPEGFSSASEAFLPSESFFLSPGVPQTAAATAAAAALAGPPPSQLLLQQQREQQSRRRREGDEAKKEEDSDENGNVGSEEGSSVEAVGVMRNAVSHVLRNLQEVCIPGLLCSCSLESESFNYLAARLDEWTKAVHAHRQLCASVLSNPKVGGEKGGTKDTAAKAAGEDEQDKEKTGDSDPGRGCKKDLSTDPATDPQAATMVLAPYLKLFAQCIRKNRLPNEMEAEVQVLLLDALVHLGALSGFGHKPASDPAAGGVRGPADTGPMAKGDGATGEEYPKAVQEPQ
uniref:Uncharacterized protein NCLIV_070180 n=1 Tax=Neospora caninum (strain Liverpool) TaxID=572307 RepID=F0JBA8_NEOCL|nr:unnamed protein product [Neospora caninum Liverpool]CEL71375.1 TPA: hypothetical protein, conserved [Neospora caninum Liverpool]